ncbi:MAG: hypothetical protein DHS20C16_35380 [Phycisphaerae bacterium]|nr:MAG: hypothetical protein DHS20C16_35380 [Phycisphaerae bacterium]
MKALFGESRSLNRLLLWGVFAPLLLFGSGASAGDVQDLERGHLEITQQPDGDLINVEARCVKMSTLIEAIADATGLEVNFDRQYESYVSLYFPGVYQEPVKWIDAAATLGGVLFTSVEDNRVSVKRRNRSAGYQAELTSQEVKSSAATTLDSAYQPSSGVNRGVYSHAGHFVPPPYRVYYLPDGAGGYDILVNGLPYKHLSGPPQPRVDAPQQVQFPQSGQFESMDDLRAYVCSTLYPNLLNTHDAAESRSSVVAFLESQQLIGSIVDAEQPEILVRLNDRRGLTEVFPVNYNWETGGVKEHHTPSDAELQGRANNIAQNTEERLGRGAIIFRGSDGSIVEMAGAEYLSKLKDIVDSIGQIDVLESECLFAELLEIRHLARELAVNLEQDKAQLSDWLTEEQLAIIGDAN